MRKLAGTKLKKFNKRHKNNTELVFILDNLEYARNIASIFNLAYALKVGKIYLTGITSTPPFGKELSRVSKGHEEQIQWQKHKDTSKLIKLLRSDNYLILSLAKTEDSLVFSKIKDHYLQNKIAIIVGNEKQGLANSYLKESDNRVYVPVYRPLAHLNIVNELAVVAYSLL